MPIVFVDGRDLFWWGIRTPPAAARLAAARDASLNHTACGSADAPGDRR